MTHSGVVSFGWEHRGAQQELLHSLVHRGLAKPAAVPWSSGALKRPWSTLLAYTPLAVFLQWCPVTSPWSQSADNVQSERSVWGNPSNLPLDPQQTAELILNSLLTSASQITMTPWFFQAFSLWNRTVLYQYHEKTNHRSDLLYCINIVQVSFRFFKKSILKRTWQRCNMWKP